MLALFVNNDYTDVVKRRKYSTSCTYDYPRLAFFDTLVLICPLTCLLYTSDAADE